MAILATRSALNWLENGRLIDTDCTCDQNSIWLTSEQNSIWLTCEQNSYLYYLVFLAARLVVMVILIE